MGACAGAVGDDQPFGGLGGPLIRTARDLDRVPVPDPGSQGRYPLMLEALGRVVAALGREVCIVACFDQYPFSLASALMGLESALVRVVDDPAFVEAVMERCLEYGLAYGRALASGGAAVLSGGDSPAGLLGPEGYRAHAWPFERRLIEGLKSATGKPVSLHICGEAGPLLADMAATGADVVEIDQCVDLAQACRLVGRSTALWGNLDPVAVLARGTVEEVEAATRAALDTVAACGHERFVLSSGCTLPVETPPENLEAMLRVCCRECATGDSHPAGRTGTPL
jgi:MtaA/CmuA family methyltransferase